MKSVKRLHKLLFLLFPIFSLLFADLPTWESLYDQIHNACSPLLEGCQRLNQTPLGTRFWRVSS